MIRVTARITKIEELERRLAARLNATRAEIQLALDEAATIVHAEAQRLILDPPKTGRVYAKSNPKRIHQASAPNEAPANDLGNLAAGVVRDLSNIARGRVAVASTAPYAKPLELGGRGGKLAPRPYLRRALYSKRREVRAAFVRALRRAR